MAPLMPHLTPHLLPHPVPHLRCSASRLRAPSYFAFLRLPGEVRNLVYKFYFAEDGGYHYNHQRGLLATAEGKPVRLSLMYVCQLIASETMAIPFAVNPITFTTGAHRSEQHLAGCLDNDMSCLNSYYQRLMDVIWQCSADPAVYNAVAREFPQFAMALDEGKKEGWRTFCEDQWYQGLPNSTWGEAPSFWREASAYTLGVATQMDYKKAKSVADEAWIRIQYQPPRDSLLPQRLQHHPWIIPSENSEKKIHHALRPLRQKDGYGRLRSRVPQGPHYRFSAAATAIRFMKLLPTSTRLRMRKVVLREDQQSAAFPACHGLGFIPLCNENRSLRVERHVSLFGNIWQRANGSLVSSVSYGHYARFVAVWLVEAMRLVPSGMPPKSFTFVLDGNPAPDKANAVFEKVIQRNLVYHLAMDECYRRGLLPTPSQKGRRHHHCYVMEGFPEAMRQLSQAGGTLQCNFDPGLPWNVDRFIDDRKGLKSTDWAKEFNDALRIDLGFDPEDIIEKRSYAYPENPYRSICFLRYDIFPMRTSPRQGLGLRYIRANGHGYWDPPLESVGLY